MQVPLPCRCFSLICYKKCVLLFTFCFSSHLINSASHFFQALGTWSSRKRLQLCKHKIPFLSPGSSLEETKTLSRIPPHPFFLLVFFLLQAKQINKPDAGLKSLEGSSLSPGHGLLILAAVLIAVNGFPFSYSLQTLLQAAFCGLCSGFPSHEKDNSKINGKTCPPHCISGVSQPIAQHTGIPKL